MNNLMKYLSQGMKNTVLFRNNAGTSHKGPWKQVYGNTLLDRWHVGDFSTVEYTISADFDRDNKEIINDVGKKIAATIVNILDVPESKYSILCIVPCLVCSKLSFKLTILFWKTLMRFLNNS